MPAYVIVGVDVADPEAYSEYTSAVPTTLEPYGGRFIVRGGTFDVLEGDWPASRIVVLIFPSVKQAKAWHDSAEYQAKAGGFLKQTSQPLVGHHTDRRARHS